MVGHESDRNQPLMPDLGVPAPIRRRNDILNVNGMTDRATWRQGRASAARLVPE